MAKQREVSLEEAISSPIWDSHFWDAFEEAEEDAREALRSLWEKALQEGECSCDTCVVRTVLEAIVPIFTREVDRIFAINQPVQTMGGGCGKNCRCNK